MADQEPTTPTPLPVTPSEPRPLVIPHVLTPEELAGLLRVGEALSDIQVRLAAMMGRPGGPVASELRDLADLTIELLDLVEGDPDGEEGGDAEPSLGWSVTGATTALDASPVLLDLEEEHDGREPSLCGLTYGHGDDGDREEEHCGLEPDEDDAEPWHNPPRLDVFAEPFKASFDFLPTPIIEGATRD